MAEVHSLFPLSGKLGDMVFYRRNGKIFVRRNTSVNRNRIKKDPAFEKTRVNNDKLAAASSMSSLIRAAFAPYTEEVSKGYLHQRLCSKLMRAGGMDPALLPSMLDGFEWGERNTLPDALRLACHLEVDLHRGAFELLVADVPPTLLRLDAPAATHYSLYAVMVSINPARGHYKTVSDHSGLLETKRKQVGSFILSGKLSRSPENSMLLTGIGVQAFQRMNGEDYALVQGASFSLMTPKY